MGFRKDSFATVWSVEPKSDTMTKVRISISRKNKQTDQYEQDFSGFVDFVGTVAAKNAAMLKEKDHIRLGDVDVTTSYNKEKGVTYTNFKVFNFTSESFGSGNSSPAASQTPKFEPDNGEIDDENLPF